MKINKHIYAAALTLSVSFGLLKNGQKLALAQPDNHTDKPPTTNPEAPKSKPSTPMTPEQALQRHDELKALFLADIKTNFYARQNNGSQRSSVSLEKIPKEIREQAAKFADEYKNHIYPELQKYLADNGELPNFASGLPQFKDYMVNPNYNGIGEPMYGHKSWFIGRNWRLDGSYMYRDVYSKVPPDAPHDVWARNSRFLSGDEENLRYAVNGWDDGRVTFDHYDTSYSGISHNVIGDIPGLAFPGEAGIPPETKLTKDKEAQLLKELKAELTRGKTQAKQNQQ